LYTAEEIRSHGFAPLALDAPELPGAVILSTAHQWYATLDFADLARRGVRAVVDGRSLWRPEEVRAAGLIYIGVGRP
jgi:UDP-N-acetyl-D-mannosaminuronate dehydrogenase